MLSEFRSTNVTWDKATSRIYSPVTANESDENGRKLVVQIVNGGQVEDLTGASLHLYWITRDKLHDGLDVFKAVNLKKSEFELSYTTGMLSNKGVLNANLVLVDTVGRIVSERFKITVTEGIDNDAIQSENSFSSLTQALIDISNLEQNYAPRLNDLTAQLADKVGGGTKAELEDLSDTILGAIDGSGGPFNLLSIPQDKSVTPTKTTFLKAGVNKFMGDYHNVVLLNDGTYRTDANGMSAIIPISGGRTYHFRKHLTSRSRLAFMKSKPSPTSSAKPVDYYIGDIFEDGRGYTAPEDATHLIYVVSNALVSPPNLQITEGEDQPFFIGYDFLSTANVSGLRSIVNELGMMEKNVTAQLYGNSPILNIDYMNRTVTVPVGVRLFYNGDRLLINNAGDILEYEDNLFLALYYNLITGNVGLHRVLGDGKLPDDTVLIGLINPVNPEVFGLDIENCMINGNMYVPQQTIQKIEEKLQSVSNESTYYFLEDITGVYDKPTNVPSGALGSELDLVNTSHTIIYDIYDDLVARFPERFTRSIVGQDSSGLNIYQYSYKAPRIGNANNLPISIPKIIVISGVHGFEQGAVYSTAMFFKDLFENWETKEQLEFIYWNIDFEIIPVVNPYGYDNNQRKNYNGVDINRNFFEGTNPGGDPSDPYFSGHVGMSEPETQIVATLISGNMDAEFFIDYHNIGSGDPMSYTHNEKDRTIFNNLYRTLSKKWAKDYQLEDGKLWGHVSGQINNTATSYALQQGLQPLIIETPWKMPFANTKYDKITLETGAEAYGNLIVIACKSFS